MPVKIRAAKERRAQFSAEVLALFTRLETPPGRKRNSEAFRDAERELMYALNLGDEFWAMQSPLDRSRKPCRGPEYFATTAWHTCRAIRLQLLEATGLGKKSPTKKAGQKAEQDAQPSHGTASNVTPRIN
jgi:hypothetical protein